LDDNTAYHDSSPGDNDSSALGQDGGLEFLSDSSDDADPGCLDDQYLATPEDSCTPEFENTRLDDLLVATQFIRALQSASSDDVHSLAIDEKTRHRLRNPPTESFDIDKHPDLGLALEMFLISIKSSVDTYNATRKAVARRYPEDSIPSYDQVKKIVTDITGVASVVHPMCKNSCVAFTGPFADLDKCPKCQTDKICPTTKKPYQEFHTILIGPLLQALWRDPSSAQRFYYRRWKTWEIIAELQQNSGHLSSYDDFFYGSDYLENVKNGRIRDDDIVLMLSIDGAQLYAHKASDCWIYIWIIMDFSPDERYKKAHVLPGGFIPGPNKPKNMDSFLFPGLHHLCVLQKEGLVIWDAFKDRIFNSNPFLGLDTADGPGMVYLDGFVGHHGKYQCRLYCPVPGRHKPNGPHYYPALLKPVDYVMPGCDHTDISHFVPLVTSQSRYLENLRYLLESPNETQYKKRRLETGITKPSLFLGIPRERILGVPGCFGSDIMHLASFNLGDLIIPLWRGVFDRDRDDPLSSWSWAVLQGEIWEMHGREVAAATPFLPGSFDRPPRNIADKINSGYKAWEWLLYLYGLTPALLYNILPEPYYSHHCKLVRGMRILHQHHIRTSDLILADKLLRSYAYEFEVLYYQRNLKRLHFCRPSLHALLHLASEVTRIGPPICSSQWTMERTIGNLGEEIRQPSNPYANLSQRGLLRCQVNVLTSMIPSLQPPKSNLPWGAVDLGQGFALLCAQDRYKRPMRHCEVLAFQRYLKKIDVFSSSGKRFSSKWCPKITRWARLRLPNGQVARSRWKEGSKPLNKLRTSRNIKVWFIE
jgi:hypothetical protein